MDLQPEGLKHAAKNKNEKVMRFAGAAK